MAVMTLAFRPTEEFWRSAFALADRVEKTDPARAQVAPLRIRLSLMARTAGVRFEADVLQHLRGITLAVFGGPNRPGRATGGLATLHFASETAAARVVALAGPGLAKVVGREVSIWQNGRDGFVAWGSGVSEACRTASGPIASSRSPPNAASGSKLESRLRIVLSYSGRLAAGRSRKRAGKRAGLVCPYRGSAGLLARLEPADQGV